MRLVADVISRGGVDRNSEAVGHAQAERGRPLRGGVDRNPRAEDAQRLGISSPPSRGRGSKR